jgi:nicotinic acid mononucleotide adenylyltransferase
MLFRHGQTHNRQQTTDNRQQKKPDQQPSSTFILKPIKEGKNIVQMLPKNVWEYLDKLNFYR